MDDVSPADLEGVAPLLVGLTTHGGFPTEAINNLAKSPLALEQVRFAALETRTKRAIFS